jgi:cytochrome b561
MGPGWFLLHSVNGLIFVTLALIWTGWHLASGLQGRPGPKLGPRARRFHAILHRVLIWGLFLVAVGGFALGLTSAVLMKAGGFLPIAPPLDLPRAPTRWQAGSTSTSSTRWPASFWSMPAFTSGGISAPRQRAQRIMAPRALHRWL